MQKYLCHFCFFFSNRLRKNVVSFHLVRLQARRPATSASWPLADAVWWLSTAQNTKIRARKTPSLLRSFLPLTLLSTLPTPMPSNRFNCRPKRNWLNKLKLSPCLLHLHGNWGKCHSSTRRFWSSPKWPGQCNDPLTVKPAIIWSLGKWTAVDSRVISTLTPHRWLCLSGPTPSTTSKSIWWPQHRTPFKCDRLLWLSTLTRRRELSNRMKPDLCPPLRSSIDFHRRRGTATAPVVDLKPRSVLALPPEYRSSCWFWPRPSASDDTDGPVCVCLILHRRRHCRAIIIAPVPSRAWPSSRPSTVIVCLITRCNRLAPSTVWSIVCFHQELIDFPLFIIKF